MTNVYNKKHLISDTTDHIHDKTVDAINVGIVLVDPEGSIVLWNHWMEEKSGFLKNKVIGSSLKEAFSKTTDQHFFTVIKEAIDKGSASILAQSIHKAPLHLFNENKADKIPQAIEVQPLKIGSGPKFHCLIQISDVSTVVNREAQLRSNVKELSRTNDSLERALNSGNLSMWDWNIKTQKVHHDRMMEMLGYDHEEPYSNISTWQELVHREDWPEVKNMMIQHLEGRIDEFDCEYRLLKSSGDWMWISARAQVVEHDDDGNALRLIGITQDVTRRKLAEIEATKASEEAIEAARVKTEFLGNMSHELRTPMNGVMGVLNLLKESDMSHEQLEYIEVAQRSAEHLLKLIDNVLDFSKLGANSVQLELISFDPEQIIQDVVKLLSESAKQKNITFDYLIEDSSLNLMTTDPGRLRQVLINLVGNAINFTSQGHVQIRLLKMTSDEHVLFEIEDTGVGIPEDSQDIIFDAFAQADASTTREYGGTGLGLGICKQLVELMGGKIMVESESGKGSTFSFTIEDQAKLIHNQQKDGKADVLK